MQEHEKAFQLEVVSIRLVKEAPLFSTTPIDSPRVATETVGKELCEMDREVVCVINLTSKGMPINCSIVSIGVLDAALCTPREILKSSILSNASGILLVHNHPSGDVTPSKDDIRVTKQLQSACECMGLHFYDHVIVGGNEMRYYSFCEEGQLQKQVAEESITFRQVREKGEQRCR